VATSTIQRLIDSGLQFGEMSKQQAEQLVKQLVKIGDVQKKDAEKTINAIVARGRETSEQIAETVQREVSKQVTWLSERFDDLENRFEELAESITDRVNGGDSDEAAPAKKKAAGSSGVAPVAKSRAERDG